MNTIKAIICFFIYNYSMTKSNKGLFSNYFKPSIYIRSFKDLDIGQLKLQGIKLFISDLDNTLVPHYTRFPNKDVISFVKHIQNSGIEFVVMSNNIASRVKPFGEKLGVEWHSNARKPFTTVLKKIIKAKNYKLNEVVYMGDQILLDIWVANRMKIESILVQPLVSTDYKMNWFNIFLEKRIYKNLSRKNILKKGEFSQGRIETSFDLL